MELSAVIEWHRPRRGVVAFAVLFSIFLLMSGNANGETLNLNASNTWDGISILSKLSSMFEGIMSAFDSQKANAFFEKAEVSDLDEAKFEKLNDEKMEDFPNMVVDERLPKRHPQRRLVVLL